MSFLCYLPEYFKNYGTHLNEILWKVRPWANDELFGPHVAISKLATKLCIASHSFVSLRWHRHGTTTDVAVFKWTPAVYLALLHFSCLLQLIVHAPSIVASSFTSPQPRLVPPPLSIDTRVLTLVWKCWEWNILNYSLVNWHFVWTFFSPKGRGDSKLWCCHNASALETFKP